jgi:hypothetical protein
VNKRFERDTKLIALAGTGYWDFGNQLRIGPYSSFFSTDAIEGWRVRVGFWTMPGISGKWNFFGYGAYGTRRRQLNGMFGLKYVWDAAKWTKTSLSFGSDYDFIIDADDELDNDNLISSMLRKKVKYTRMFVRQVELKHQQYISPDFSAYASVTNKELNPVFAFSYHPIDPVSDKPENNVLSSKLPIAEASIGLRYAHRERTAILNYDQLKLGTFYPAVTLTYVRGFEFSKAQFEYQKINLGVEHRLRLPPKSMLYYKIDVGKVFGTLPYLLLNIPAGNEYYVASKYLFNTMVPYEFVADRFASLHTRFYLGGSLLHNIPLLGKLGWRERFSFNAYWGDMTKKNQDYNKNSNFSLTGNTPFMEVGGGVENIFHVVSVEYYRRITHVYSNANPGGIYVGVSLSF